MQVYSPWEQHTRDHTAMKLLFIFSLLFFTIHLESRASPQTIYDAANYYKPMTDEYDVRLRGQLFMPPCVQSLLNCWEVIGPELVCKYGLVYRIALESICMDLRFQCAESFGPRPFETLNVSTWKFCAPDRERQAKLDYRAINGQAPGAESMGVNNVDDDH